jgi:hypothetical protein
MANSVIHMVGPGVTLHPDALIKPEIAEQHGLVTEGQIADWCGLSQPAVWSWAHKPRGTRPFPEVRARLSVDGKRGNSPSYLYSADEVRAWVKAYRRKYLAAFDRGRAGQG